MRTLYFECAMGAAGDMIAAALLELVDNPDAFVDAMNNLGLPGVHVARRDAESYGVHGTRVSVKVYGLEEDEALGHKHSHDHEHEHTHAHVHEHTHGPGRKHDHSHSYERDEEFTHSHEHVHAHYHDHVHEDDSGYAHNHLHDHGHSHESIDDVHHSHSHSHKHSSYADITAMIDGLAVSDQVKQDAQAIYKLIAEAESSVHGTTMEHVHFHEVGSADAVADVVGACLLIEQLAPECIFASPVHVGSGTVMCAHGVLPVPAPATALILEGVPIYGGEVQGELCTPTGAAILKHFAEKFCSLPPMVTDRIGYGMGTRDFGRLSAVRAFLGETE